MPENISPEEKLLNLIRGNEKPGQKKETSPRKEATPQTEKDAKPKEKSLKIVNKEKKKLGNPFLVLNKFLGLILLVVLVYMVLGYKFSYKSKTDIPEDIEIPKEIELVEQAIAALPSLNEYTNALTSRQIFKMYEAPKPKPTGPPKPKVTLQQLLSGYVFVGIIFGEPSQAIVEEKRTKQSYYLSAGQYLGEIKIEKIEKGKITVSYGDETMDIRI